MCTYIKSPKLPELNWDELCADTGVVVKRTGSAGLTLDSLCAEIGAAVVRTGDSK